MTSLFPVGTAALIFATCLARLACEALRGESGETEQRANLVKTQHISAFLHLTYLVLPTVAMTQLRGCVKIPADDRQTIKKCFQVNFLFP